MNAIAYITTQAEALPALLARRLDGLTEDQLVWRPAPRANHIAFIVWHCLRACDWQLGRVRGVTPDLEAWHTAGFRDRTGYDPRGLGSRGLGIGTGYTLAMVEAVPADARLLEDYAAAISQAYVAHLATMTDDDLEASLAVSEGAPPQRAYHAIDTAIRQFHQHMGECDYLRGLLGIPDPTAPREPSED
ncbi:MAG: DinB family protein [Dehalococcoidia bacterium]|nr:DinB family protein [Dehalococcoidia bacterium]